VVALPWTSGPVALFIGLERGPGAGAASASGSVAGCAALLVFCLAYAHGARRWDWPRTLLVATLAFAVVAPFAIRSTVVLPLWLIASTVVGLILVGRRALPAVVAVPRGPVSVPRWELPFRMAVAAGMVVILTEVAQVAGAGVSGLLAMYPVITIVLSVFAHRDGGPGVAIAILRGLVTGLAGTAVFLAVVAWLLPGAGAAPTFGAAIAVTIAFQAVAWRVAAPALAEAAGSAA